ncbi:NFACT family protein, partial [Bacillus sp. MHSD17]|nr:NFACT family protein [Bacillus sp. MHSD17]
LSAHPTYARLHLTNQNYDSPALPPMFCMLLRKHLEGGFIEKIEQIDLERIIQITVRSRNEIGDESLKTLVIEIMGRHSNIILVDTKTNNILDSLKHVSLAVNRHRTVYAGAEYVAPPAQHKINPLQIATDEEFIRPLDFLSGNMDKQLVGTFTGISPLFAKEVVKKAGMVNEKALADAFFSIQKPLLTHTYSPTMTTSNGKEFFYLFPLAHLQGENKTFSSVSELLDRFFFGKAERDRVKQQAHDLERFMQNEKNKNEKKLIKLQKTLQDAGKADKY